MSINNIVLKGAVACSLFFSACATKQAEEGKADHPNIVFIYADDLGWADLGCYGNTYHETPNIDRLAQQGMKFTDAYAPAPVCSPARAGVFSGQYPARVGLTDWIPGHWRPYESKLAVINRTQYLPLEIETMGESLQKAGYHTGYFGKWHLGYDDQYAVENQGFDEVVRFTKGGTYYNLDKRLTPPQPQLADSAYLTDVLTDFAIDFIDKNKDSTFMLVVSHFAVHLPLDVPDSLLTPFLTKEKTEEVNNPWYAAMMKSLDNNVGRLMDKLDALGLNDNTMIVFYSDNGGLYTPYRPEYLKYTRNQPVTSNAPLRGEKGNLYEGGIRVPLIVKWPGHVADSSENHALVNGIDFYPTFLELANYDSDDLTLDGKSIVPIFDNPALFDDRTEYWHYPVYHHDRPASAVRCGDYKLIKRYNDEITYELYHLKNDLAERNDLSETEKGITNKLIGLLDDHLTSIGADMPQDNPNFDEERRAEWGDHPDAGR
ncbi:sulfatase [Reichenbachiella carrageenanivorans]|uniref:Sulfatase n=1 Tax=Reichenbachiella carrageenanivorans TaxID=2979869 RepID=A0ABY6D4B3_9BACT|nr:sulfatase [Reichenbachiella carrageenanivorans]UXX80997.1 sulfatase [Reichenbachiella carrageenanivorans]